MTPKCESYNAGYSDMAKSSHEILPLSENGKVPDLTKERKQNHTLRLLRFTVKTDFLSMIL